MPQSTLPVRPGIGVCIPWALCVIGMGMVVPVVMPVPVVMSVSMAMGVPMAVRVAIRMGVAVVANMPMRRGRNRVGIGKVDAFMTPRPKGVF